MFSVYLADGLANYLIALADGAPRSLPSSFGLQKGIGAMWLIFEFMAILGFGFATIFKQSAMAISIGLGYVLVVEALVFSLQVRLGDALKAIHELFEFKAVVGRKVCGRKGVEPR